MKNMLIQTVRSAAAVALLAVSMTGHAQSAFTLKSADVVAGGTIPQEFAFNGFGCTGQNVSPSIEWSNLPAGTKSLALMVHDPDAQTGGAGFWHWAVIDIPATVTSLVRGAGASDGMRLPQAAKHVATDFGMPGWGGPCPPVGDKPHRYVFTLYALKVDKLPVPAQPTASLAGFMVNANAIAKAEFTATYGR
ncbi:YbhB/YbcL family Raf kinase inhibitor-like protein [Acidovorax sp.]|uniref:YbhB/YbcL family Raf kinase inhibitor-like protein n=1 Tax=Acidovorax sp. TaxID=1872122 RepID=UPI00391F8BDE